jgi:hypothetical protein
VDETGSIANDRFFGVGLIRASEPSRMLRAVQNLRDRRHWYKEFHFSAVTKDTLDLYKELVDVCLAIDDLAFFCFIADRTVADPIVRFGDAWTAYAKMAEQLIVASFPLGAVVTVVADNYSTPATILFEEDLRDSINRRFKRMAVTSVFRADSRAFDGLQVVDLFTSAAASEFRCAAGLASPSNPKSHLAAHVRECFGADSLLAGWRDARHSVQVFDQR